MTEKVRVYPVGICDQCIRLEGQMCHNPECVFCRRTMEEVGEYLDVLLIRPIVGGKRFEEEFAFSMAGQSAPRVRPTKKTGRD